MKTAQFTIIRKDHWQSLGNLFKGLQGGPVQSYENSENYEIYENCEIYDNSPYLLQYQRNVFKGLQGSPIMYTVMAYFNPALSFQR